MVEAKSGRGVGGAVGGRAVRGADVLAGGAAPVCWDTPLAADRVVHVDGDIVQQSSDYVSPPQFSRFWSGDENNASEGRCHILLLVSYLIMETSLIRFNFLSDFTTRNITVAALAHHSKYSRVPGRKIPCAAVVASEGMMCTEALTL